MHSYMKQFDKRDFVLKNWKYNDQISWKSKLAIQEINIYYQTDFNINYHFF